MLVARIVCNALRGGRILQYPGQLIGNFKIGVGIRMTIGSQIHILWDEEGIDERDIYVEKESGRQFERPVYRSLVDNILREGDLLVVTELKRFGRNYGEIYKEWFHITKEIGATLQL